MRDGIWAAPSVRELPDPPAGARIFHVHGRHRVVVLEREPDALHGRAREHVRACATGWREIQAFEGADEANAFSCYLAAADADAWLAELLADPGVAGAMAGAFNATPTACATRSHRGAGPGGARLRRSWVTALHDGMPADVFHADGCDSRRRPAGHDFFTALAWPHGAWADAWGGAVQFAPQECGGPAGDNRSASERTAPVLAVSPRPDRLVLFSGPLLHRATHPSAAAPAGAAPAAALGALRGAPSARSAARWRLSSVQQLTCFTGRDMGPYADAASRSSSPVYSALAFALTLLGCYALDHVLSARTARAPRRAPSARPGGGGGAPSSMARMTLGSLGIMLAVMLGGHVLFGIGDRHLLA